MTATLLAATISAAGAVLSALLTHRNKRRLDQVHVLVNSRLENVIRQLAQAQAERDQAIEERDQLDAAHLDEHSKPIP